MTLSTAQLQERRDAARARWDKARQAAAIASGAAAGAAVGGIGAARGAAALRERLVARARPALEPLLAVARQHNERDQRLRQTFASVRRDIRSEKTFHEMAARLFNMRAHQGEKAGRALAAHQAVHSETFFDSSSGETVAATDDIAGQQKLEEKAAREGAHQVDRLRAIAADLKAKGRPAQKKPRAGGLTTPDPTKPTFSRRTKGKEKLELSSKTRQFLETTFAEDAAMRARRGNDLSHFHELGIRSVADLERHFLSLPKESRKGFADYLRTEASIPRLTVRRPKKTSVVRNVARIRKPHTYTIAGYPKPEERKKLRAELNEELKQRLDEMRAAGAERKAAEMAPLRPAAAAAGRSLRWLRPGSTPRHGIVGAGIAGGALAGAFLAGKIEQRYRKKQGNLAKSDDYAPEQKKKRRPTLPKMLIGAAESIEAPLATGVARAFNAWKGDITPDSIQQPEAAGALLDRMIGQLYAGMAPLDDATEGGLDAPTRVGTDDDGPRPRFISFAFGLRSSLKDEFTQQYRLDRVREFTDEQRDMLRTALVSAAVTGDGPDVIARKIRSSIGLTQYQAGLVANYRKQLETLDRRSLNYALRDKRYDGVIERAINQDKGLSDAQIEKAVDAYHRKFLAYRATTIARTESLRAANNGHIAAVRQFLTDNPDFTVIKTWIATNDDRTRPDHVALNRTSVEGLDTAFQCDDGSTIKWPHDPDGTASQCVNCRCSFMTVIVPKPAAQRNGADFYGTPYDDFWTSITGTPISGDLETA